MYRIDTYDFSKGGFNKWETANDFPAIYILENGKHAYIGESGKVRKRAAAHSYSDLRNYKFKNMHIITGENSNKSVTEHYETLLIRLMAADGKFIIIKDSDGNHAHNYSAINESELDFDELWGLLEQKELVNTKDFRFIMNTGIYKYSPNIDLTLEQKYALTRIINTLDSGETFPFDSKYKTRPIVLTGEAGTGKTVVATSLFYKLRNIEKYKKQKIALVIPNPSMRKEIQDVFAHVKGLYKKDVISPAWVSKHSYDIIICDETHKLRRKENLVTYKKVFTKANERLGFDDTHDELDWILKQSTRQILFYDKKQCVSPSDIRDDYVKHRFKNRYMGVRPIELKQQIRVRAGRSYVPYIYDMLYQRRKTKKIFKNYDFRIFTNFTDFVNAIFEKNDELGLCRLCTCYPWKWASKGDKEIFDIIIDGIKLKWNSQTVGWISNKSKKKEVGSVYTLHGLDLNYAGVIIGPDLFYDKKDKTIKVNKARYFDKNVKKGTSGEDLKKYVLNTYAVLLTRGIEGTYIYVCDDNLREYLNKYIDIFCK